MNNLESKVANYKLIARESLRMELISPRLSRITCLENSIEDVKKIITEKEHEVKVENYEITKLDTDHPNYDKKKEFKENRVKEYTESIERNNKQIEEIEKDIAEQKEGIAKIENGETKVSVDSLNCLVDRMIEQDALVQVKA